MITKFRKKPVVIDAVRWTGSNLAEMAEFAGTLFETINPLDRGDDPDNDAQVFDKLHSVWVPFASGDWVIRGVQDELYPCKDDVFRQTYEPADDGQKAPDGAPWYAHLDGPCGPECVRQPADG